MTQNNPWFSWDYITRNWSDLSAAFTQHWTLTVQAIAIALLVAVPLAMLARRYAWLSAPVLATSGVLYTIPSLALFAILVPFTGIGRVTVLVALVVYALLVLVRNMLVGLADVPDDVVESARGMGYGRWRILLTVELPIALPAIIAGIRIAVVSTVALVTVGVVVGYGGLGQLMFRGFRSNYRAEITTSTLLCVALAFVADLVIVLLGRAATPWLRTNRRSLRVKEVAA